MPQENPTTKFKVDISELKAGIQESNRLIKLANSEFKAAASGMDDWANSTDGLTAKINQLTTVQAAEQQKLTYLKQQYALTAAEMGENSKGAQELAIKINNQQAAVNKVTNELNTYNNRLDLVKTAQANAERSGNSLEDELRALEDAAADAGEAAEDSSDGYTVFKDVVADLISDVISNAIDKLKELALESGQAYDKLQASIGATSTEMQQYKKEMNELYNDNFGESLDDIADKFAYIKQVTGETDPSKIKELTANAITLEDTFGSDFNETVRGVSNLMTHFGLSSDEAFDLFAKGSQEGLDYTDELGDNIAEYGGNFAQAGYSAEEYFQLLKNGAEGGAYNLDKVNDSINEVKNRLGDGTIKDNLSIFSDGTQDLFKKWENGEASMKDVINSIVGDISNCKNEQDALTMAQVAFGTMGEDANLSVVESLTTLGDEFSNTKGKMDELKEIRYDNLDSALGGLGRTLQTAILGPIVEKLEPVLTDFVNFLIQNMPVLAPIITGLATAFGVLAAALAIQALINGVQKAMAALNLTMYANPYVLIAAAIAGLVAAFIYLWNTSDSFKNFFVNLWSTIKTAAGNAIDAVVGFFKKLPGRVAEWFTATVNKAKEFGSNLKTKASDAGSKFISTIIDFIKTLPSKVWEWFKNTVQKVVELKSNLISKGKEAAQGLLTAIVNKVKEIPGKVKSIGGDIVEGIWNGINDKVGWIKDKLVGFKDAVINKLKDVFDINSPSRVARDEIGKNIAAGVADGITKNTYVATKAAEKLSKETLKKAQEAEKKYTESVSEAYKTLKENINSVIDDYEKELQARSNAISSSMNLFEEFNKNTEVSGQELIDNLKSQVTGMQAWITALDELEQKGVDSDFLQALREMGVGSAGEVDALNKLTAEQLNEYVELWKSKNQLATDEAKKELTNLQTETVNKIADLVDETKTSIAEYKKVYDDALKDLGVKVKKQVIDTDKTLADTAADTILKTAPTVGRDMVDGIISGLDNRKGALYARISSIISGAIDAAQSAAEIASPSKIMRDLIGQNLIKGIEVGMGQEAKNLYASMKSIVGESIGSAKSSLDGIGMTAAGGSSGGVVNNYTFNQTNNSPKSLSRLEIYRQTKNQFRLLREF